MSAAGSNINGNSAERQPHDLVVVQLPDKVKYRAGEEIDFTGMKVVWRRPVAEAMAEAAQAAAAQQAGGAEQAAAGTAQPAPAAASVDAAQAIDVDVSAQVLTSIEEGTAWRAGDKKAEVELAYTDDQGVTHYGGPFTLKRKRRLLFWLLALLLVAAIAGAAAYFAYQAYLDSLPKDDPGSLIIPQCSMTDEELQRMLDEQAEKSRFTVSVRPSPELYDGLLHVNFLVESPNNGLSERLEVEQGGNIVVSTGVVAPGYMVEWAPAPQAAVGPATATVYAVDENGKDMGNPASVEIEIVQGTEGPS